LLTKLRIENYALVERVDIDFRPGLTVLTGETGAGKSVVIGGLLLALGERADRDFIRHGSEKTTIRAVFDIRSSPLPIKAIENSLDTRIGPTLTFRREVNRGGSSRAYANDGATALAKIKEAASMLVDFHSQQGQRSLLDVDQHIAFLDSFAGLTSQVEDLSARYDTYVRLEKMLHEAQSSAAAMRGKLELVNFQIDELSKAHIREGEENKLESERRRLESVHTLMETGQNIIDAISEDENAVVSVLSQLDKRLRDAAEIDKNLSDDAKLFSESIINLNELTSSLQSYMSRLEDDPQRLNEIDERLSLLYRLRKKYGTDEAGLIEKLEKLKEESQGASDYEGLIKDLRKKLAQARKAYHNQALHVSEKRSKAAPRLEKAIRAQLADLAMSNAKFKIDFQREYDKNGFEIDGETVAARPHGLENAEFFISTNPNEPIKPMVKIASGGELSRIMLALLSVIAGKYKLPTIIFDEIDTGIGGATANKLAVKLKELSKKRQVIVISHLPVIAAHADHNLAVGKELKEGRNVITVTEVTGDAKQAELARMSGDTSP